MRPLTSARLRGRGEYAWAGSGGAGRVGLAGGVAEILGAGIGAAEAVGEEGVEADFLQ